MSCPVNTFNKSKEDFIWFVKKAVTDQKSYSHSELYHSLLKLFVDADTNKDGLVSRASFSKLIDAAAAMPRAYGYAPTDAEQYKLYLRAALASPTSPEYVELYWFMLELFTEADTDKDGIVKLAEFASMMDQLVAVPKKHGLTCCPPQTQYEALLKQYDPVGDGD